MSSPTRSVTDLSQQTVDRCSRKHGWSWPCGAARAGQRKPALVSSPAHSPLLDYPASTGTRQGRSLRSRRWRDGLAATLDRTRPRVAGVVQLSGRWEHIAHLVAAGDGQGALAS